MNVEGGEALLFLFVLALFVGGFVLWIWALIDALRVPDDAMYPTGNKLVWVLVIILTGFIGAIIYLAIGRPGSTAIRRPPSPPDIPPPPPPP
jgi:hypothetical protein